MMAATASCGGVTRLLQFEVDITTFERQGGRMVASAEASTLGLPPGVWPDWFTVPVLGTFVLRQVESDGTHVYAAGSNWLTIFND